MKHDIGLRGYWTDKTDKRTFWYKLKGYGWELRKAFHRFWRGYENQEVFNFDQCLIDRLQVLLPLLYEGHHEFIDAPEVDEALLKMIDLLRYYDEFVCEAEILPEKYKAFMDQFDGITIPEELKYTTEDYTLSHEFQKKKIDEFFNLFKEYFERLWI